MALENGTYINSLDASNPTITDQIDQGDDHLRLIKSTIKSTFPNITGAVTLTHTQINDLETRLTTAETDLGNLDAAVIANDSDLATLDAGKANIAGDTFTGDVTIQGTTTLGTATATTVTDLTDSSTNIATTSFVQQNKITTYASQVHGDTANSSGVASITVDGTAGAGTDFGLELSYRKASQSAVGSTITVSDFNGKKFLFVY